MRPMITIWTQAGCPRCDIVKRWFLNNGYEVTEKDIDALATVEPADLRNEVMADLQMQDGALPLVYAEGEAMDPYRVSEIVTVAQDIEARQKKKVTHA